MIRIAVTTQKRMYKAIQYLRALWTLCMTSCSFETRKWNPFSHSVTTYVFNTRNTRFHLLLFHGCFNFNHLWMKATLDYPVFDLFTWDNIVILYYTEAENVSWSWIRWILLQYYLLTLFNYLDSIFIHRRLEKFIKSIE